MRAGAARKHSSSREPAGLTDAPLIDVEHLSKWYGRHRAVDDVTFSVGRGEVVALLGPNGSGKSTLMRCLIGFFPPTSGQVRVGGTDVAERPVVARRQIGYLPEHVMLYPELTVRRYLRFVAGMKGLTGRARRAAVDGVIAECALDDVADRHTGKLSKGYRQRVGLAQALLGDPEVLVLDEPTVGLDPMQTIELRDLVRRLHGRTVLLSTHILSEAATLCSRVVILKQGRLAAVDTPDELAQRVARVRGLVVRIEGPAGDVEALLAGLPGVTAVDRTPADAGDGDTFRLTVQDPEPVQRALAPAVVQRGWTLREVRAEAPTLEELFVRLVG
jgi:ABC-2 type transport system ATP-binding protein